MISRAVVAGLQQEMIASGVDVGEGEDVPSEVLPEDGPAKPAAESIEAQPGA